jgi:hypothetical protein
MSVFGMYPFPWWHIAAIIWLALALLWILFRPSHEGQ